MKKTSFLLSAFAAVTLLASASVSSGAVIYRQTSTTGLNISTATIPSVLDDVTFATGATLITQELTGLTFGFGDLAGTAAQTGTVFISFYGTVNAASTGVVESNYLGGFGGTFNIPANATTATTFNASSFTGLNTLTTPIFFTGNSVGIVITLADSTGNFYSTVTSPLLSVPGAPTIGSSVTGVYRDTNGDGDFEATELTPAQGNLYLSITTTNAPVPEPSTWAMMGLGLIGSAVTIHRRRLAV